jgi:hypothetical protein
MADLKFKNKIRGKALDHVVSLCQAVVVGKEVRVEAQEIDLQSPSVPHYSVQITKVLVSKVIHQTADTPRIPIGAELAVFPASLPKHVDQFKLYYEERVRKSCIYESYTCEDSAKGERFYFINFTCFGWCLVCLNSSEGKAMADEVVAHTRAAFPEFNG